MYDSASGLGNVQGSALAADDSGGVYVVANLTGVSNALLYAWRLLADGTIAPGWPAEGFPVRDLYPEIFDPSVVATPDGANGLLIGIMSYNPTLSMRAFRMGPTGLLVAQGHPDSLVVKLLGDGADGAYVVWNQGAVLRGVRITSAAALASGSPAEGVSLMDPGAVLGGFGPPCPPSRSRRHRAS